ncbi:hypothetical protein ACLOJK_038015 [Asimina triloba]
MAFHILRVNSIPHYSHTPIFNCIDNQEKLNMEEKEEIALPETRSYTRAAPATVCSRLTDMRMDPPVEGSKTALSVKQTNIDAESKKSGEKQNRKQTPALEIGRHRVTETRTYRRAANA